MFTDGRGGSWIQGIYGIINIFKTITIYYKKKIDTEYWDLVKDLIQEQKDQHSIFKATIKLAKQDALQNRNAFKVA